MTWIWLCPPLCFQLSLPLFLSLCIHCVSHCVFHCVSHCVVRSCHLCEILSRHGSGFVSQFVFHFVSHYVSHWVSHCSVRSCHDMDLACSHFVFHLVSHFGFQCSVTLDLATTWIWLCLPGCLPLLCEILSRHGSGLVSHFVSRLEI